MRGGSFVCTDNPRYLTGSVARDISRMTDIPPDDAGLFIDLSRLGWWDRFRVMWAFLGGHWYCDLTENNIPICARCDRRVSKTMGCKDGVCKPLISGRQLLY